MKNKEIFNEYISSCASTLKKILQGLNVLKHCDGKCHENRVTPLFNSLMSAVMSNQNIQVPTRNTFFKYCFRNMYFTGSFSNVDLLFTKRLYRQSRNLSINVNWLQVTLLKTFPDLIFNEKSGRNSAFENARKVFFFNLISISNDGLFDLF